MQHRFSYMMMSLSLMFSSKLFTPLTSLASFLSLALVPLVSLLLWCSLSSSVYADVIIYQTYLNEIDKGALFVLEQHNTVYLAETDVRSLELTYLDEKVESFESSAYLSLHNIDGITYRVDQDLLELHIVANPELLPLQSIDLSNRIQKQVLYPQNESFFLNYGASYLTSESFIEDEWQLSFEAGYRKEKGIFLTDGYYKHGFQEDDFIRLQTRYVHDDRDTLKRYTFGDQVTPASNFGSRLRLGGFGVSRNFLMDPYAVSYPTINVSGLIERPSEIKVYLDGQPVSTIKVDPGRFELINLNRYGGAGEVELVIRDAYGREERIRYPFYISDNLLKRNDQTYSYHIGLERQQYGQESFDYEKTLLSGYHLYGVSDQLSVGGTAEMLDDHFRLAPTSIYKIHHYGVVQLMIAASSGGTVGDGYAGVLLYDYRRSSVSVGFQMHSFSQDYSSLADIEAVDRKASAIGVRGGLNIHSVGSFSYDYLSTSYHGELDDSQLQSLVFNRPLGRSVSLFVLMRKETGSRNESSAFVNISWTPIPNHQASVRSESLSEGTRSALSFSKNTPTGQGYGYRVGIEKDSTVEMSNQIDLAGDYHGRYGVLSAGVDHYSGDNRTDFDFQAGGAFVWIGKKWHASRPVKDSFALIKIGSIENVRIYRNAEEVARTDVQGEAVVPGLTSFYHNRISFDDRDVPLEYQFPESGRYLSPPYRSGSCLGFAINKIRPVIGHLFILNEGEIVPLEFKEVVVVGAAGEQIIIETGRGGEFYLDRSASEKLRVETRCDKLTDIGSKSEKSANITFVYTLQGEPFQQRITLPDSETFFLEIGDVTLETNIEIGG